ncbi:MAG: sigma-70 family RNA polymerase sigma factor [Gemmatimonadetes bacterium]|uniref:RNA polymerase sigma factor n=1 Tax=Candidatus Kutchimonas denitrificans TaxID=3056748 RepID=A0AAE4ZB80_9BACT|nr:sigma-70 family RNA polymerase sigma factor [Gemmatimonadota bacterium]NIR76498.1 sigma-70 family RNA polymerase sigma factor [Candidatus Kutchimonas denitrificans]NIS03316.1 sigma-70 family RNA polymerase sigma factor [Gemmatimonadota bacterium]NIT69177.1 sigma-70 family RNA polymerase sigma factor [Gemmatimonadota bacterium]NIU54569.1 sigma-70 family RNA polymerase sigma factor [Gemmatimonadota bacterium]
MSNAERRRFEREVLPHLDTLRRVALRFAGGEADADDLVQETLLKAFRAWGRLRDDSNVRAWLLTILRNTYINLWRRPRRRAVHLELGAAESLPLQISGVGNPEKRFFHKQVDPDIRAAIDDLPDEYRTAFLLQVLEGHGCESIAGILSVPVGTVKSRVHRARNALRRQLRDRGRNGTRPGPAIENDRAIAAQGARASRLMPSRFSKRAMRPQPPNASLTANSSSFSPRLNGK